MRTSLYTFLIALHPESFRSQFGPEMESIFDEAGKPWRLVADAYVSLARQWLLRSQFWIWLMALAGGMVPFALGFGFLRLLGTRLGVPLANRHAHRAVVYGLSQSVTMPFIMLSAVIAVLFISGTMILAVGWFRRSQLRRV